MRYVFESQWSDGKFRVDENSGIVVTETAELLIFEWMNDCGGLQRITVIKKDE